MILFLCNYQNFKENNSGGYKSNSSMSMIISFCIEIITKISRKYFDDQNTA